MSRGELTAPPRLRHRHRKSGLFAVLAASSLGLGVLVVVMLVFSTLRSSMPLANMHATLPKQWMSCSTLWKSPVPMSQKVISSKHLGSDLSGARTIKD